MASANVLDVARERGYWDAASGRPFVFHEAYNPDGRTSFGTTRREWRVLDLLAPSLGLHGNSNVFPFSVKPERPVTPETIMELFRDTFEGTDYDVTQHLTVTDDEGKTVKSPLATPFMPYDMNKMLRINGGWGWRGERQLARWYCMYVTVTQSRAWLPDAIGGIGRTTGFGREAAWWAFNRVATIAGQRWGEMRKDVAEVRNPIQQRLLAQQAEVDARAQELLARDPAGAAAYLTEVSRQASDEVIEAYWKLGDQLWTRYHEKW
jgi:dipeptidase